MSPEGRESILEVIEVSKQFLLPGNRKLTAVDRVSLSIDAGETFGLVGQSGGGKTTLGLMALGLIEPTSGEIRFQGRRISRVPERVRRPLRRQMQMVFQDPLGALNPRRTIGDSIELPLINFGYGARIERRKRIADLLHVVGVDPRYADRFPHEFSGGQAQRIGIARALAVEPSFILLDEPVSSLDVSIQAQILNLLKDLQARFGLTYLIIAHDMNVVRFMSDRVAVMRGGKIVEMGYVGDVIERPKSDYTKAMVSAALSIAEPDTQR